MENGGYYVNRKPFGEPMLSKYDLYPTVNTPEKWSERLNDGDKIKKIDIINKILYILNYSDGEQSIIDISEKLDTSVEDLIPAIEILCDKELLEPQPQVPKYRPIPDVDQPC
jgi:aminopeptidase-like protein